LAHPAWAIIVASNPLTITSLPALLDASCRDAYIRNARSIEPEQDMGTKKVTIRTLLQKKKDGIPITMVTAYDATFARLLDEAGVDTLLVGDSLGNVIQGRDTTVPVTLEHMIYHSANVSRGASRAHIVTDLPFLSYGASDDDAIQNAGRLMKEGGAEAIKLEGGRDRAPLIERLVSIGIPVLGHLGLLPQSVHQVGGFRVQGRDEASRERMIEDARILEQAGAYGIVLEMIPRDLARDVSEAVNIPTIGIGAGPECDGQVLVCYDMFGLNDTFKPKFLKHFATLGETVRESAREYCKQVEAREYPSDEHSFQATTSE
jgi:3-methyl-2-oxobutanoate hydroxymethyltransferase